MVSFRSLFALAAASLVAADQVIFTGPGLASGWADASIDGAHADYRGNSIAVTSEDNGLFKVRNPSVAIEDYTSVSFDIRATKAVNLYVLLANDRNRTRVGVFKPETEFNSKTFTHVTVKIKELDDPDYTWNSFALLVWRGNNVPGPGTFEVDNIILHD